MNKFDMQNLNSIIIKINGNTTSNQVKKIEEELKEVKQELLKIKYDSPEAEPNKLLEELWDLKQSVETLMYLKFNQKEIKEYENIHTKKMIGKFFKTNK